MSNDSRPLNMLLPLHRMSFWLTWQTLPHIQELVNPSKSSEATTDPLRQGLYIFLNHLELSLIIVTSNDLPVLS